ncbi:MAG: hypothetical protein HY514_02715 [Candidatus Aenigmarchaeota archaeon]|nr:hypothetical protein [Candidatus Aenigmarchaeota archaeon]
MIRIKFISLLFLSLIIFLSSPFIAHALEWDNSTLKWDNSTLKNRVAIFVNNSGVNAYNVTAIFKIPDGLCAKPDKQDIRFYYNDSGNIIKMSQQRLYYDNNNVIVFLPNVSSGNKMNVGYLYCGYSEAESNDTLIYIVRDNFTGSTLNASIWSLSLDPVTPDAVLIKNGTLQVSIIAESVWGWEERVIYNNYIINKTEAAVQGLTLLSNQTMSQYLGSDCSGGPGFGNATNYEVGGIQTGTYTRIGIGEIVDGNPYLILITSKGEVGSLCGIINNSKTLIQCSPYLGTFSLFRLNIPPNDNQTKIALAVNQNWSTIGYNSTTLGVVPSGDLRVNLQFQCAGGRESTHLFKEIRAYYGNISFADFNITDSYTGPIEYSITIVSILYVLGLCTLTIMGGYIYFSKVRKKRP